MSAAGGVCSGGCLLPRVSVRGVYYQGSVCSRGGVCSGGGVSAPGSLCSGGCLLQGGVYSRGVPGQDPPTDTVAGGTHPMECILV